jgi:SAM-dependent methyltransferase
MTPCPRCNGGSAALFTTTDLNRRTSPQKFTYYQCSVCGLIFLHPIPADLARYYPDAYYNLPAQPDELLTYKPDEGYKLDLIRPFAPTGRLFEVGPAIGVFAYLAKRAGYQVEVMETDHACCEFIDRVLGIPADHSGDIVATLKGRGQYDVIALWHVIEHLPNPWSVLPVLADHLSPGGALVIAAPNPQSIQFGVFRHGWAHVDAPRHLELIPSHLLINDLVDLGLRLRLKTTADSRGLFLDRFGWQYSLHSLTTRPLLQRLLRGLGIIASLAAKPIERLPMRGSAYTLVLTKDAVEEGLSDAPGTAR